jgi:glycosyltransferase involved in cell wall biosynthesis
MKLPSAKSYCLRWVLIFCYFPIAIAKATLRYRCNILLYRQQWFSFITGLIGWIFRMKIFPEVNSALLFEYKQETYKGSLSRFSTIFLNTISEYVCYRIATKIIVVADNVKEYIVNQYKIPSGRIAVVSNGTNIEVSIPLKKSLCRKILEVEEYNPVITFIGSFFRWQGLEIFVESVHYVRQVFPKLKVLMAGDGEIFEDIIKMIKRFKMTENFSLAGRVDYQAVPIYIGASDICVGRFEQPKYRNVGGSPLKIPEYLACGRPVVCSKTRADWEYIENYRLGTLVDPDNPRAVGDAFINLLSNPNELSRMEVRCRNYAEIHLSWKNCTKKIEEIIKQSFLIPN